MVATIEHLADRSRFQVRVDGLLCVADYHLAGGVMHLTHTEVHPALQGRGIAAELVKAVLAYARTNGLKVNPLCSYVQAYLRRHSEEQDLLA